MRALRQSSFTRYVIIPITLLALFSGCYKWSTPSQSPADFIREEEPSKVLLTRTNYRELVMENPVVTDSAITGSVGDSLVTIPLEEVIRLKHRKGNLITTLGGISLFAATVGFLYWGTQKAAEPCREHPNGFFC